MKDTKAIVAGGASLSGFVIACVILVVAFSVQVGAETSDQAIHYEETTLETIWQKTSNTGAGLRLGVPRYDINNPYWSWTDNVWNGQQDNHLRNQYDLDPHAYWRQSYPYTHLWFRVEVFVPERTLSITMLDPYKPGGIIPINDNFYVYVNGVRVAYHGTSYDAKIDDSCREADRWCVPSVNLTSAPWLEGQWNDVWILAEEWCVWGGIGYLEFRALIESVIPATIDCDPDTLNLKSKGNWITCYIELSDEHDPRDINASTILLNEAIQPELDLKYGFVRSEDSYITDRDGDGIAERMVKFDRTEVEESLTSGDSVSLTVTGQFHDGTEFEGADTIRVINPG
ncbi:MAG: hypothetical protein E3J35_07510 [Methanomassiliicoccales archaeon]|nr:MAG: hypothetical protein E3J35_07510 [Methanomassiliicoccales archaeon]